MEEPCGLVGVDVVAAENGTSPRHIRHLVYTRRIPFVRVGGLIRFERAELARWRAENSIPVGGEDEQ